jgi:hypothetical protein
VESFSVLVAMLVGPPWPITISGGSSFGSGA